MLPSILAKQLEKGIGDYFETTFPMANEPFKGSIKNMLAAKDSLYHEPYVAVRLPFRVAEEMPTCFEAVHPAYRPYVHQQKAFDRLTGNDGRSTLVATGTGSGKTECFLYPILEYCYQHRGERGIKALIIYPMNALASDQAKRIAELIYNSPELRSNVTAGMYVGGFTENVSTMMTETGVITDKVTMLNNPPDILLTNYKMLDYLLVRPNDADLWKDNKDPETLKYIAVDELHTFDGAQGTDLACLLRRLKSRLGIQPGYLCCIGTSATMGGGDSSDSIRNYASEIFGEPFSKDSVIVEDRLSADEFFAGSDITDFTLPTPAQREELENCVAQDDQSEYIKAAVSAWIENFEEDPLSDEGKLSLGKHLMHHSFMQSMITMMGGNYYQESAIAEGLKAHYPALNTLGDGQTVLDAMFALISYARIGTPGHLRPFLNVQVQLWLRELRRFLGKVSADHVTYAIAHDLNAQQSKQYLPIINCRDCGATGWVSLLNERQNVTPYNLDAFYNKFFKCDEKVAMMFPYQGDERPANTMPARLCPECLQVKYGDNIGDQCDNCGSETVPVYIPQNNTYGKGQNKQYICPCCGSRSGLYLIGLRSATEISASISQIFASKFNDDKKTLAFSDNVQDAAHRAGFFNSRTWKFGLRSAIQRYVQNGGSGKSLEDFMNGFLAYWHSEMTDEEFVSFFIAPNMTWMRAYEDMLENRELKKNKNSKELISDIENRLRYEILQEYGMQSKLGRTLEKSACSCLAYHSEDIEAVADAVQLRTINELGALTELPKDVFKRMVAGFLDKMRTSGAFEDPVYTSFVREKGKDFLLSNSHIKWLPGVHGGKNAPHFIAIPSVIGGAKLWDFDVLSARKYTNWIEQCVFSANTCLMDKGTPAEINSIILQELVKANLVVAMDSPAEYTAYGINKGRIYVTDRIASYQCDKCGTAFNFAAENSDIWDDSPCMHTTCSGSLEQHNEDLGYYGKLYSGGDMARINAREHTGLLERNNREQLEIDFKRKKDEQKLWDPNVLSCTPTLEMGIDIGDLSTVILCSMPPAQAQFLQRAGRAGRKDGNALTLAVAAARPHDLYFYADPLDMIAGQVNAPKIFLRASAVLERQFVAYCMDSWVKKGVPENAIPKKVGQCLAKLDSRPNDVFPFNFLLYAKNNLTSRLNSFIQMFSEYLDDSAKEELTTFARGSGMNDSPMYIKVLNAFEDLQKQQKSLQKNIKQLKDMIKDLEAKPKDSSYDEEIKELKYEESALINVLRNLQDKDVFNFLSDEGLLPNYAFPEAGIVLKAVLWRYEDENESGEEKPKNRKYEKKVYEYSRGASSAISEFAPNNSFYVDGKKLTIDQIDMTTAEKAPWRLCPNCSHAQIEEAGKNTAFCPRCGSPAWADAGQVRNMLKVQMVYSNMDYTKSAIGDDSEERTAIFYKKQMLVDVDVKHDIASAYSMNNDEFNFGYEFVKKAKLREINFGENDTVGEKMMIAGEEDVRKGFKICKYCGKVQPETGKAVHTKFCKTQKFPELLEESTESYLFLFREFQTEILRLLIPATTMDTSNVKTESFVAAFMLGMKEHFGNVDHLRATVSEVPVRDADYRKQFLVIYDSVPGGTGYLKQLMHEKNALVAIFEKALAVMENCTCKDDPQKDGCYHCLYAYRQSQRIGNISRSAAVRMLKTIISGKDNIEKIETIEEISVNPLFDSELESRFIKAIGSMGNESRKINLTKALVKNKVGYLLTINDITWEIEPQRTLDSSDEVSVTCKPDFVFWPVSDKNKKPVAIFTDGFQYHDNKVADDTLKREAIRRSEKFRVWALSWKDVQGVFEAQGHYATDTLTPENMPAGSKMYQPIVNKAKASALIPAKMSSMELLLRYLYMDNAEDLFQAHAKAYSLSLLEPTKLTDSMGFTDWNTVAAKIESDVLFTYETYPFSGTLFGRWIPRTSNSHLSIYAGIETEKMRMNPDANVSVYAVLDDLLANRTDKYAEEWNGLWQFFNVMQFNPRFVAVCQNGLEQMTYLSLNIPTDAAVIPEYIEPEKDAWSETVDLLIDNDTKEAAKKLKGLGIKAPNEVGYELADLSGEVLATIEMAWTDKKIAYLTEDQLPDKETIVGLGWTVIENIDDIDAAMFGGEDK